MHGKFFKNPFDLQLSFIFKSMEETRRNIIYCVTQAVLFGLSICKAKSMCKATSLCKVRPCLLYCERYHQRLSRNFNFEMTIFAGHFERQNLPRHSDAEAIERQEDKEASAYSGHRGTSGSIARNRRKSCHVGSQQVSFSCSLRPLSREKYFRAL